MIVDYPAGWPLFHEYEEEIKRKNRFFLSPKFVRLFKRIVNNESNINILSPNTPLFRARVNKPSGEFELVSELRGNKNAPSANRASPVGIPYTYLAEDAETAIAEIRANVSQLITVAEFRVESEKRIITLSTYADYLCSGESELSSMEICSFILYLSHAFAAPIKNDMDYLPCQYFAEYCKQCGFSGIRYVSAARGFAPTDAHYNYVIFKDEELVFREANLYKLANIKHTISHEGPSFLKDDSNQ